MILVICVAVVIVNYKTPELVKACLASLAAEQRDDIVLKVYVGDAESGDGSVSIIADYIAAERLDFCKCFAIGTNGGFAYGNNFIVDQHVRDDPDVDFVHFLNPDTYVRPGAITALVAALQAHPQAGIVGSRLENADGSPRAYGFRFPTPWREFFRGARLDLATRLIPASTVKIENLLETRRVDWVTGASFMMPRAVIDRVGLMDPRYFLYYEEVDLNARVHQAGYEIWHVADSRVVHIAGQATGVRSDLPPKRLPSYWYHSRFKFFRDRYGWPRALLANGLFLLGDLVFRAHRLARLKPITDPPSLWRDMLTHGFSLPPNRSGAR